MNDQVNVGVSANDGRGDTLRGAMQIINRKFAELYTPLTYRDWAPGVAYKAAPVREIVYWNGLGYVILQDHISTTIEDDEASGYIISYDWLVVGGAITSRSGASLIGYGDMSVGVALDAIRDGLDALPTGLPSSSLATRRNINLLGDSISAGAFVLNSFMHAWVRVFERCVNAEVGAMALCRF